MTQARACQQPGQKGHGSIFFDNDTSNQTLYLHYWFRHGVLVTQGVARVLAEALYALDPDLPRSFACTVKTWVGAELPWHFVFYKKIYFKSCWCNECHGQFELRIECICSRILLYVLIVAVFVFIYVKGFAHVYVRLRLCKWICEPVCKFIASELVIAHVCVNVFVSVNV